jgi:integrase
MGELLALRWRDVDFELRAIQVRASYTHRQLDTPKNRTGRTVPMIDAVATALAQLEHREYFTRPDGLVFASAVGRHLDDSALRRRYKRARQCRRAPPPPVPRSSAHVRHPRDPHRRSARAQEWMGHADFATTQIYLSYKPRAEAAERLARAFETVPTLATGASSSAA